MEHYVKRTCHIERKFATSGIRSNQNTVSSSAIIFKPNFAGHRVDALTAIANKRFRVSCNNQAENKKRVSNNVPIPLDRRVIDGVLAGKNAAA